MRIVQKVNLKLFNFTANKEVRFCFSDVPTVLSRSLLSHLRRLSYCKTSFSVSLLNEMRVFALSQMSARCLRLSNVVVKVLLETWQQMIIAQQDRLCRRKVSGPTSYLFFVHSNIGAAHKNKGHFTRKCTCFPARFQKGSCWPSIGKR